MYLRVFLGGTQQWFMRRRKRNKEAEMCEILPGEGAVLAILAYCRSGANQAMYVYNDLSYFHD